MLMTLVILVIATFLNAKSETVPLFTSPPLTVLPMLVHILDNPLLSLQSFPMPDILNCICIPASKCDAGPGGSGNCITPNNLKSKCYSCSGTGDGCISYTGDCRTLPGF